MLRLPGRNGAHVRNLASNSFRWEDALGLHPPKGGTAGVRGDGPGDGALRQNPRSGPQRFGEHGGMFREKGPAFVTNEEPEQESGPPGIAMLA